MQKSSQLKNSLAATDTVNVGKLYAPINRTVSVMIDSFIENAVDNKPQVYLDRFHNSSAKYLNGRYERKFQEAVGTLASLVNAAISKSKEGFDPSELFKMMKQQILDAAEGSDKKKYQEFAGMVCRSVLQMLVAPDQVSVAINWHRERFISSLADIKGGVSRIYGEGERQHPLL